MKSPFPGMDPYLERFWNDVHGKLVAYIADDLNEHLPGRYRATMQERVFIAEFDEPVFSQRYPDVAIVETPSQAPGGTAVLSRRAVSTSPVLITYESEPATQYYLEIVDSKLGGQVVTAIEVLSPDNKRAGDGQRQYEQKKFEFRSAKVGFVEIDLLCRGHRTFEFPQRLLTPSLVKPYYVIVRRPGRVNQWELYALDLREALPAIDIPLREGDPDVALSLQPLMDRVYRNGRFPIDYAQPCDPPLEGEEATWAAELTAKSAADR